MITKPKMIRFGFYRDWFTFPFSINATKDYLHIGCYWGVSINFLWWHLRIYDGWYMRKWMKKMKKRKEQNDE